MDISKLAQQIADRVAENPSLTFANAAQVVVDGLHGEQVADIATDDCSAAYVALIKAAKIKWMMNHQKTRKK